MKKPSPAIIGIMFRIVVLTLLILYFGCETYNYNPPATIPNLKWVEAGVWRSGQPKLPSDWVYLRDSLGINKVVKLNEQDEGQDVLPAGMTLYSFPISTTQQLLTGPDPVAMSNVVCIIRQGHVLVHCGSDSRTERWMKTHDDMNCGGNDRTGLAIGLLRLQEGWTAKAAYSEMLTNGFHPVLHGLHEFWEKASKGEFSPVLPGATVR